MRMGPVELRMMRGWPPNKQKTVPAKAVPRKLSITPLEKTRTRKTKQMLSNKALAGFWIDLQCHSHCGDLVIVSSIPKQSSKGDGIGDAAQVDEEHSRNGLDMEAVIDIATIPRDLPFDVQPQSPSEPIKDRTHH